MDALDQADAPESAVSAVRESGEELTDFVDGAVREETQSDEYTGAPADVNDEARAQVHDEEREEVHGEEHDWEYDEESDEKYERLRERVADLEERTRATREQVEETNEWRESTDQRLDAFSNWVENIADDVARVDDEVDEIQESHTPGSTAETTTTDATVTPETPLEQTAALPQEMIDEESPNVRRAIFVASGVDDYSRKVPAGRAIKSSELRKVLRAGTDCNGHTETVSRVMDVLDRLGGDDVKIVDRRGEKRVVFTQEAAERLVELVERKRRSDHTVVTPTEA